MEKERERERESKIDGGIDEQHNREGEGEILRKRYLEREKEIQRYRE